MTNASLKEQLQAVASQLTEKTSCAHQPKRKFENHEKPSKAKPEKVKPKWLTYVQYGVELLRTHFPEGFKTPNEIKPLKKGIKQDLIKRLSSMESIVTEDKACMVKSLSYYVNTSAYLKNMVEGAARIDLDGQADGVVTAEEAKYSFDRQQAKIIARQQAKSENTKNNPGP